MPLHSQDLAFLASKEVQEFVIEHLTKNTDPLKLAELLSKTHHFNERKQVMDYMQLVPKFQKKFETDKLLLCDTLALEQSTAKDISMWKQKLFLNKKGRLNDLCCGMGGDSFYLPPHWSVTGVDLDPLRLQMYQHNTKAFSKDYSVAQENAIHFDNSAEYFLIDPARRSDSSENQRNFVHLTPSIQEILKIASRYRGGLAKIPPGYPLEEIPKACEVVYLGKKSDCREALVLFGDFVENSNKMRAVILSGEDSYEWVSTLNREDLFIDLEVEALQDYIIEPAPVLIRSRLFVEIALQNKLSPFSKGIAYLTSKQAFLEFGFANFKVLETCELKTGAVKKMLKKHDIGTLTLKKRGVEVIPEQEIKRLAPKGKNEATLFYTRIAGEKTAVLTERIT